MTKTDLTLVIAVLTFRRPEDLRTALPPLLEQAAKAQLPTRVMVVDNDTEPSAKASVLDQADERLLYVHEPTPGIAAARNRALSESHRDQLLVFIDDDETPSEHWLASMLDTYTRTRATAVVGPVVSEYAQDPEPWIVAGEFFNRRRLPSGSTLRVAATNNLLLDLDQIRKLGVTFDDRFGLTGGSDTLFTRQIVTRGGRMVWCDEAVVVDRVPAGRLTRSWVLRRAFRSGNAWSRVELELAGTARSRLVQRTKLLGAGTVRLIAGFARSAVGTLGRSPRNQSKGLRTVARGAGMTSGAVGYVYSEYKRAT